MRRYNLTYTVLYALRRMGEQYSPGLWGSYALSEMNFSSSEKSFLTTLESRGYISLGERFESPVVSLTSKGIEWIYNCEEEEMF